MWNKLTDEKKRIIDKRVEDALTKAEIDLLNTGNATIDVAEILKGLIDDVDTNKTIKGE